MLSSDLFTNDLDQHPLPPPPVKLPAKDLLPSVKVKPAIGHGDAHLMAHNLAHEVGVGIVF
jgi:hypothetical protein